MNPRTTILLAFAFKSIGDALAKGLREVGLPASELTFLRFAGALVFFAGPLLWLLFKSARAVILSVRRKPKPTTLDATRFTAVSSPVSVVTLDRPRLIWRGLLGLISVFAGLYAAPFLTLGDARAIFYINPILFAVFGWMVFRDHIPLLRIIALLLGFAGVLIVANPTGELLNPATLGLLIGGTAAALSDIEVKKLLIAGHSTDTILRWFFVVAATGMLPWCIFDGWFIPSPLVLLTISLFVAANFFFQYLYTNALTYLAASEAAPYQYTAHFWLLLIDILVWNISPDNRTLIGTLLIIGDGGICWYLARKR